MWVCVKCDKPAYTIETFATKPLMFPEHITKECDDPMACSICMQRCYEGAPGHIFLNDNGKPCACGKYENSHQQTFEEMFE